MNEIIPGLPVADGHAPDKNTNAEQIVPANDSISGLIQFFVFSGSL
jgi:hypothetical protein